MSFTIWFAYLCFMCICALLAVGGLVRLALRRLWVSKKTKKLDVRDDGPYRTIH